MDGLPTVLGSLAIGILCEKAPSKHQQYKATPIVHAVNEAIKLLIMGENRKTAQLISIFTSAVAACKVKLFNNPNQVYNGREDKTSF